MYLWSKMPSLRPYRPRPSKTLSPEITLSFLLKLMAMPTHDEEAIEEWRREWNRRVATKPAKRSHKGKV